jgi:hypothetical protein
MLEGKVKAEPKVQAKKKPPLEEIDDEENW